MATRGRSTGTCERHRDKDMSTSSIMIWFKHTLRAWAVISIAAVAFAWVSYQSEFQAWVVTIGGSIDAVIFLRWIAVALVVAFLAAIASRKFLDTVLLRVVDDFESFDHHGVIRDPWAMSVEGRLLWLLAVAAGLAIIGIAFLDAKLYFFLIEENGLIELGSFAMWGSAALMLAVIWIVNRPRSTPSRFVHAGFLLFFIVCAGEEISWGQQIFRFDSPDIIISINKQGETNLHNIGSISVFAHVFFMIAIGVFVLLPWLEHRFDRLRLYLGHYGLPIVHVYATRVFLTTLLVWLIVGIRFGTLGFHPYSAWGYYTQMDDEVFEFFTAYAFFVFAALNLASRVRASR